MKKEKQVCTFGKKEHEFNHIKRGSDVERAPRPKGSGNGQGGGKPVKNDTTSPTISQVTISNVSDSSVTISWLTNEVTTGSVEYGITTEYGTSKTSTGSTSHYAIITGLTPSFTYQFKIVATDAAGNISTYTGGTFSTTSPPISVVYLEFYGTTISGTMWNVNGPIVAEHSGLTTEEISAVIAHVRSQYSMYNILITDDINVYNNAPYNKKQRVVITESNEWYGNGAGGVAYIGSWGWTDQSPAWVFSKLLNYNSHYIAEAISHEFGHQLGLRHQCVCTNGTVTADYNPGDGITAPIMGVAYYVPAGSWWVGPTPLGCSNIQDDNQIITAKLGLK